MRPLTYILLFIFLTCVFTIAGAVSVIGPRTIELTEAEAQACAKEGGCVIATQNVLDSLLDKIKALETQLKAEKSKQCV